MSNSRERKNSKGRGRNSISGMEDVNPMTYLSNLSDAMLVLAVGIMVALVIHWNVELNTETTDASDQTTTVRFKQNSLTEAEVPDNAKPAGEVYFDYKSNAYYIVKDN